MTLFAEHSYNRVMLFVDYRNLKSSALPNSHAKLFLRMDLYRLAQLLVGERELIGAYIFDAVAYGDKSHETRSEHDKLRAAGFRVVCSESLVNRGDTKVQKEVDVAMACSMLEHALQNHFDIAIVISGDRDFVPAMQRVQAAGKRVEVAAFANSYSEESKNVADVYYLLDEIPFMSMRSPNYSDNPNEESEEKSEQEVSE